MMNRPKTINGDKDVRFGERFFYLLCAYPLFCLSQTYALGLSVSLLLGHWPRYGNPGPFSLGYVVGLQAVGVIVSAALWMPWPLLWLAWMLLFMLHRRFHWQRHGAWVLLAFAGHVLSRWELSADPAGLHNWFRF